MLFFLFLEENPLQKCINAFFLFFFKDYSPTVDEAAKFAAKTSEFTAVRQLEAGLENFCSSRHQTLFQSPRAAVSLARSPQAQKEPKFYDDILF